MDDQQRQWYEAILTEMFDAVMNDRDPVDVLRIVLLLGYPTEDVLRLARMFDAMIDKMHKIVRAEVENHGKELVTGIEDFLRSQS